MLDSRSRPGCFTLDFVERYLQMTCVRLLIGNEEGIVVCSKTTLDRVRSPIDLELPYFRLLMGMSRELCLSETDSQGLSKPLL